MSQPRVIVIAGTDTGVGKTWTGCALARTLSRKGKHVVAIKPLETGCEKEPQPGEDGVLLAKAAGQSKPEHALFRFSDPVAPPEAADRERRHIDFDDLIRRVRAFAVGADVALVEGAGGLMSPLTWKHNAIDVALALEARVVLVAADRLGTLSHTLMALKFLELRGLDVMGIVLTAPEVPDSSTGSNAAAITRITGYQRLLRAPRVHGLDSSADCVAPLCEWL